MQTMLLRQGGVRNSDVFSSKPGAILFAEPHGGPIRILRVEAGEGKVGYVYHSAGALWIARGAEAPARPQHRRRNAARRRASV